MVPPAGIARLFTHPINALENPYGGPLPTWTSMNLREFTAFTSCSVTAHGLGMKKFVGVALGFCHCAGDSAQEKPNDSGMNLIPPSLGL